MAVLIKSHQLVINGKVIESVNKIIIRNNNVTDKITKNVQVLITEFINIVKWMNTKFSNTNIIWQLWVLSTSYFSCFVLFIPTKITDFFLSSHYFKMIRSLDSCVILIYLGVNPILICLKWYTIIRTKEISYYNIYNNWQLLCI